MFAALNTVEPPIFDRDLVKILERDEPWYEQRLRALEESIRIRLGDLSGRIGDADWLDGAFSAGDMLMVTVLRRLHGAGRSEERRVGKECVITCGSRWWQDIKKKKTI